MTGKTKFVQDIFKSTLNKGSSISKGTVLTGIGLKKQPYIGLQIKVLEDQKRGTEFIEGKIKILRSGNAYYDLEKYVKSGEILNMESVRDLLEIYFKKEYFVEDKYLQGWQIRFKIGEKAKIIAYYNNGETCKIKLIEKYPDDPKASNKNPTFGAYYIYTLEDSDKELNKKDENLL